jgi:hypothetical protein
MSADTITELNLKEESNYDDCVTENLLLDNKLRYEFTFKSNEDNHAKYSSFIFKHKYCHALECHIKPFYVGYEVYYEDEPNVYVNIPYKKYFLYKFVLLTSVKKDTVLNEGVITVFNEYLMRAAFLEWK